MFVIFCHTIFLTLSAISPQSTPAPSYTGVSGAFPTLQLCHLYWFKCHPSWTQQKSHFTNLKHALKPQTHTEPDVLSFPEHFNLLFLPLSYKPLAYYGVYYSYIYLPYSYTWRRQSPKVGINGHGHFCTTAVISTVPLL